MLSDYIHTYSSLLWQGLDKNNNSDIHNSLEKLDVIPGSFFVMVRKDDFDGSDDIDGLQCRLGSSDESPYHPVWRERESHEHN